MYSEARRLCDIARKEKWGVQDERGGTYWMPVDKLGPFLDKHFDKAYGLVMDFNDVADDIRHTCQGHMKSWHDETKAAEAVLDKLGAIVATRKRKLDALEADIVNEERKRPRIDSEDDI